MNNLNDSINTLRSIEEMAEGKTYIHQLHPFAKLCVTLMYIVLVISFSPYNITGLTAFAFYPVIVMALAEIPWKPLLTRWLVAAPFSLFAGLSNLLFNQQVAFIAGRVPITWGFLSLCSIMLKTLFTVMSVLILIATTTMPQISCQLLRMKIPKIFVEQLMLTYRYISVIIHEVATMNKAYMLRSPYDKGIKMKDMGMFLGQILIRGFDRAQRVYCAMKCRGYDGNYLYAKPAPFALKDWCWVTGTAFILMALKWFDLPAFIGIILQGV